MAVTDILGGDGPVRRAAMALTRLEGWRRLAAAAGLGASAALALPPADAVPVLLVAFPGLLWLLAGVRGGRGAFAVGWFFGFGHHLIGLYWVSFALFTDIERFWWALPLSAAGLPVLMAMFSGLATLAYHALARRGLGHGLAAPFLFAACWCALEWARGHAFTGFPWNLVGYSWDGVLPVLQLVSVVGVYGLGLLTVAVAALPAALADRSVPRTRTLAALACGLGVFASVGAWGAWRLGADPGTVAGVRLRLVQPDIDQRLKWDPAERERNFLTHLALSRRPAADPPTVVVWAETAVPYFLEHDPDRRAAVAAVTPPGGLTITGVPRVTTLPDGSRGFTNGLIAIDDAGTVRAAYDKAHLVPFGEYVPLRRWMPFGAIAGNGAEFTPGPGPVTLPLPGLPPVSPLICYEAIFPGDVVANGAPRPSWLLNLTNDAWYGHSAGPHQHFAIARVRAVEEGLPLVRVANTGISGVVDAYGRVTAQLALGERGVLDADLPNPTGVATFYNLYGDIIFGLALTSCLAFALFARHRGKGCSDKE